MRWLQWSNGDLASGLGGVEVHARCLARELESMGVEPHLSNDPHDLTDPKWDVIHTHGSQVPLFAQVHPKAIRVCTLHGSTLSRMKACNEWTWPGGYHAALKELSWALRSDVLLSIHENLSLYRWALKNDRITGICGNGWDSWQEVGSQTELPKELKTKLNKLKSFWVFIGRGDDSAKGLPILKDALKRVSSIRLVAAPGSGFEEMDQVISTNQLSSDQILLLLKQSNGLVLSSLSEGLPLVVLEALSQGLPVVSTPAGGIPTLKKMEGFLITPDFSSDSLATALESAIELIPNAPESQSKRATHNQAHLRKWKDVAKKSLDLVRLAQTKKGLK